jgi:hypothetical protein
LCDPTVSDVHIGQDKAEYSPRFLASLGMTSNTYLSCVYLPRGFSIVLQALAREFSAARLEVQIFLEQRRIRMRT